jgi:MFS family permease
VTDDSLSDCSWEVCVIRVCMCSIGCTADQSHFPVPRDRTYDVFTAPSHLYPYAKVLSLTGSVIYLSSLLSAIAATPLANSTGRKGVMWAMGALVVAATVLGASAESLAQIFVARAVAGLAVGLGFQVGVYFAHTETGRCAGQPAAGLSC